MLWIFGKDHLPKWSFFMKCGICSFWKILWGLPVLITSLSFNFLSSKLRIEKKTNIFVCVHIFWFVFEGGAQPSVLRNHSGDPWGIKLGTKALVANKVSTLPTVLSLQTSTLTGNDYTVILFCFFRFRFLGHI